MNALGKTSKETRPNRSPRSKDHTEMTKLLNPNEHNDSTYLIF